MSDLPLRSFIFGSCTKQVDAQRCVEACCGKHAETLHNAEICGRDELYPECTDEHHTECDPGADPIGAAASVLRSGGNDHAQRHDGQQHDRSGDDHMHDILKRARIAALREWKHPIADGGDPFHNGKQIDPCAQQPGFLPLDADADDGHANDLAHIVKRAELIPQRTGRCMDRAQVADGLHRSAVAGIGQRRKYHCRRVGKKAEHPQQAQLLRQGSFHGFPFQKTQYMTALRMRSALRLCAWQIYVFDLKIACADNAFASAFGAEERKIP